MRLRFLPALNALFNGLSAIALVVGFRFIKRKQIAAHRASMLTAFAFSTLFLISYITNHWLHGDMLFPGPHNAIWMAYIAILISHITLSVVALPAGAHHLLPRAHAPLCHASQTRALDLSHLALRLRHRRHRRRHARRLARINMSTPVTNPMRQSEEAAQHPVARSTHSSHALTRRRHPPAASGRLLDAARRHPRCRRHALPLRRHRHPRPPHQLGLALAHRRHDVPALRLHAARSSAAPNTSATAASPARTARLRIICPFQWRMK